MKVRLAIAKRRSKLFAAGVVIYDRSLKQWETFIYTICDGKVFPFCASPVETLEEALSEGCEILKVRRDEWVMVEENEIEKYISRNARNRWYPSRLKSVIKAKKAARDYKRRSKLNRGVRK
ncbi:hypothetical protein ES703_120518 [subsurface metagenome]